MVNNQALRFLKVSSGMNQSIEYVIEFMQFIDMIPTDFFLLASNRINQQMAAG